MRAPSNRTRRILSVGAAPVAVLLAGLMVWQGSQAAFTAETYNAGNNWQAGSVGLTDDDSGGAMFALSNVKPGDTGSKCIVVTAPAGLAGLVKTYVMNPVSGGLQNNITMVIEQGTGGTFADCTANGGFTATATEAVQPLATLFVDHATYGTGTLPWTKGTGVETKTYKFTWAFDTTGLDEAQVNALEGTNVQVNFEWELQNT